MEGEGVEGLFLHQFTGFISIKHPLNFCIHVIFLCSPSFGKLTLLGLLITTNPTKDKHLKRRPIRNSNTRFSQKACGNLYFVYRISQYVPLPQSIGSLNWF